MRNAGAAKVVSGLEKGSVKRKARDDIVEKGLIAIDTRVDVSVDGPGDPREKEAPSCAGRAISFTVVKLTLYCDSRRALKNFRCISTRICIQLRLLT